MNQFCEIKKKLILIQMDQIIFRNKKNSQNILQNSDFFQNFPMISLAKKRKKRKW